MGLNSALRGLLLLAVAVGAVACDSNGIQGPAAQATANTPAFGTAVAPSTAFSIGPVGPSPLTFATYDGSGEVVHPDMVTFNTPWHGYRFWSAVTPYPNSAIRFENPSLFGSADGDRWEVPANVKNPLATTSRGYLSDPDMLHEPTRDELWLYYREVENVKRNGKVVHVADHVWLTTSRDGVAWTKPNRLVSDQDRFVVSPSVVRADEGVWRMFQVDAGVDGCSAKASKIQMRSSANGVEWGKPTALQFAQPGFIPWHLEVQYIPERHEYWMLVAAYEPARGCMATSLFLATSSDGFTWKTYPTPVLAAGDTPQFASAVYRSTFSYEGDDKVTIWYSGGRSIPAVGKRPSAFRWGAAVTHTSVDALFTRVNDRSKSVKLSVVPTGPSVMSLSTVAP